MGDAKNSNLVGCTWIGNPALLESREDLDSPNVCERIGVFASEQSDRLQAISRDQWACDLGRKGSQIVGIFRTMSEKSILKNVLKYGGSAVWILDHKLPAFFSKICVKALMEKRLLVVSCFWIDKSVYGTVGYCSELVQLLSTRLIMWAPQKALFAQIAWQARKNGKAVEIVTAKGALGSF